MRKDTYLKRIQQNICVDCQTPLGENPLRRKCTVCRIKDNKYRQRSRTTHRAEQEKAYRQRVWNHRCCWKSRKTDEKKNFTISDRYITPVHLKTLLILQLGKCFYCQTKMQTQNRKKSDGLTIERLSNDKPHTKTNVILCCSSCNCKRISNTHEYDIGYFYDKVLERFEQSPIYSKFAAFIDDLNEETVGGQTESSGKIATPLSA